MKFGADPKYKCDHCGKICTDAEGWFSLVPVHVDGFGGFNTTDYCRECTGIMLAALQDVDE
jgi:hypothetical protein